MECPLGRRLTHLLLNKTSVEPYTGTPGFNRDAGGFENVTRLVKQKVDTDLLEHIE